MTLKEKYAEFKDIVDICRRWGLFRVIDWQLTILKQFSNICEKGGMYGIIEKSGEGGGFCAAVPI